VRRCENDGPPSEQVAVGGDASALELEAYLLGLLDLGQDHPVPYSEPWG
jgi:hypothetical protein